MNNIPSPNFVVSANMFDYQQETMTADVKALDVPEDYDSDRYHFYCSACAHQNHFARLKVVKAQTKNPDEKNNEKKSKFDAPRRFNLFSHQDSTHQCQEISRYRAVDLLAQRYNAGLDGAHEYEFSNRLREGHSPEFVENQIKTIDRASRLAAITFFMIYDQNLMARQKLNLSGMTKSFRDGFFDASKDDKIAIFRQALESTSLRQKFTTAMIFQPNPYLPAWQKNEGNYGIPGTIGPNIAQDGTTIRPINMLWCQNARTYYAVKKMADRDNGFKPLLVMGDAMVSVEKLIEAKDKSQRLQKAETVFTVIKIENPSQATPWDFDVRFADAAANQNKVQEKRRAAISRARQRGFDL